MCDSGKNTTRWAPCYKVFTGCATEEVKNEMISLLGFLRPNNLFKNERGSGNENVKTAEESAGQGDIGSRFT